MKKISKALIISLCLIVNIFILVPTTKSDIALWPGKLTINISEFPEDEIVYKKICVTSQNNYDADVFVEISDPPSGSLTEGYSNIPNLSWIKVTPNPGLVPAKSDSYFRLWIDIPEKEKDLHYNESWEVWVRFFDKPRDDGEIVFNMKLATRVFIHTPTGLKQKFPYNPFIFIIVFTVFLLIIVAYFYFKNKTPIGSKKRAVFYIKKKNK